MKNILSGVDIGKEISVPLQDWKPDYKQLSEFARNRTATVGNPESVWELAKDVAKCIGLDPTVVGVVLSYEYDFPQRAVYRANANRDDGSPTYRGITQASLPFWIDVVDHAAKKGWKMRARRPEQASLFEQIAAPFVYLDRYRDRVSNHLFTPAMIYALHQQGPGAASTGFSKTAGTQSGSSLEAIKVARLGARGRAVSAWL